MSSTPSRRQRALRLEVRDAPAISTSERTGLEGEVRDLRAQQARLVDAVALVIVDSADVQQRMASIKAALVAAERPLRAPETHPSPQASPTVDSAFIAQFASNVKPLLRSMDVEQKQGLLRLLGLAVRAGEPGDVQASVEVPVAPSIVRPIGRTWA